MVVPVGSSTGRISRHRNEIECLGNATHHRSFYTVIHVSCLHGRSIERRDLSLEARVVGGVKVYPDETAEEQDCLAEGCKSELPVSRVMGSRGTVLENQTSSPLRKFNPELSGDQKNPLVTPPSG
jgi:hypothetical protein